MPSLLVWIGAVCVHESSTHCKQIQQATLLVQRLVQLHRLQVCSGGPVDDIAISVEMRSMAGAVKGALVGIPLRTDKHKSVSIAHCHPPPGSLYHWQGPERLQAVKCINAYLGQQLQIHSKAKCACDKHYYLDHSLHVGADSTAGMLLAVLVHIDSQFLEALLHNSAAAGLHVLNVSQVHGVEVLSQSLGHRYPNRHQLLQSVH